MDVGTIRAHVLAAGVAVHSVAATVRLASPAAAILTRGTWLAPLTDEANAVGGDFAKARTRGVMSLPMSQAACDVLALAGITAAPVPLLEAGTKIEASPMTGGAAVAWVVDEVGLVERDHLTVIVRKAP